ncbi:MAG: ribosomal protein S18-alanine N-acetyltransferase [Desulfurococcales archaeon]|nr:ribosomal protein S18-alanine N-acetyltransferase [Desulfurococcales archaeon]
MRWSGIPRDECVVRPARRGDLREIYLVEVKSFPFPYPMEAFISLLILFPKYFFVAECGKRVVGYVAGGRRNDGSGHIMSLAVEPRHRGLGLGSMLLSAVEESFLRVGVSRLFLEVSTSNKVALSLYRRAGYRIVEILREYYPDGSDAYLMFKELSN